MLPPSARAWLPFSLRFSTLSQHAPARPRRSAAARARAARRAPNKHLPCVRAHAEYEYAIILISDP